MLTWRKKKKKKEKKRKKSTIKGEDQRRDMRHLQTDQ